MGHFLLSLIVPVICLLSAFYFGRFVERRSARKAGVRDPLLCEAEAEVEALLSALPADEQPKKRLALLPPTTRPKHPRLTEMQRRAIAGLLAEGHGANDLHKMIVTGIAPPAGERKAFAFRWTGALSNDGVNLDGANAKWQNEHPISRATWTYLRCVIEQRPNLKEGWVFQYKDGTRVTYADILTCTGDEPDA